MFDKLNIKPEDIVFPITRNKFDAHLRKLDDIKAQIDLSNKESITEVLPLAAELFGKAFGEDYQVSVEPFGVLFSQGVNEMGVEGSIRVSGSASFPPCCDWRNDDSGGD